MKMRAGFVMVPLAVLAFLCLPQAASAKEPGEVYLEYRAAFEEAASVDEVLAYFCKERTEEVSATPSEERAEMWAVMQLFMGGITDLKIVDEKRDGEDRVVLLVEGKQVEEGQASALTGEVTMLLEEGSWKVGKEQYKSSMGE